MELKLEAGSEPIRTYMGRGTKQRIYIIHLSESGQSQVKCELKNECN